MSSQRRQAEIGSVVVAWRERGAGPLYLHGVPNSSAMWERFLERTGGVAVDLPGFGDSGKPAHFPYSIDGYARFLADFVSQLGLARLTLVMHDWGAVGLALAQRHPELVERLVVISGVPFVAGYRWHRIARAYRAPLIGEMAMGLTFRWNMKRVLPEAVLDDAWSHFDHGTQRAILKLYRSAPEPELARAGEGLGAVSAPALIAWGTSDPFLPPQFADAIASCLGGPAAVERIEGAGHWPWLDHPQLIDSVEEFAS
ncbi:MAG TPA: alpha/beta hydrolase [Thermoleophilaceae bacterium]|nr:alpha/beta hydrolase [Thermoleophilaceae bacterium]